MISAAFGAIHNNSGTIYDAAVTGTLTCYSPNPSRIASTIFR